MTQRDIARTYVLPRETELSRTFQLSDKMNLTNSDILRSSSEFTGLDSNNNNNEPSQNGTAKNSIKLKNSGKSDSPTQSVGSAEIRDLQQKAEEAIQKQNNKKKKLKSAVMEFGKSKKQ